MSTMVLRFWIHIIYRMVGGALLFNVHAEEFRKWDYQEQKALKSVLINLESMCLKMIKIDKQKVIKEISNFLYYARNKGYGLSQPDIARETGLTQSQLSNYESGKMLPSLLAAIALADMFDISLDYLVGRCENSKAHKTMKEFKHKEES